MTAFPARRDDGPAWSDTLTRTVITTTAATDITAAPSASQKLVVTDVILSAATAMEVDLQEETSGTVFLSVFLPANGSFAWCPRGKFRMAVAGKKLQAVASSTGGLNVTTLAHGE